MAIASVALAVVFFLVPGLEIGRGIFLVFVVLAWVGPAVVAPVPAVGVGHVRRVRRPRADPRHGRCRRRRWRARCSKRAPIGYRVLGFLTEHESEVGRTLVNPSVARHARRPADGSASSQDATLIVVAQEDRRKRLPVDMLLRCRMAGDPGRRGGEPVREPVGTHPAARPAAELADLLGRLPEAARDGDGQARGRGGVAAAVLLVLDAPLAGAGTALCVRLSSPGARALPPDARGHAAASRSSS